MKHRPIMDIHPSSLDRMKAKRVGESILEAACTYIMYVLPSVVVVGGTAPPGEEGTLMAAVILAGEVGPAGAVGPAGVVEVAGVPGQHTGAVGLEPLLVSVFLSHPHHTKSLFFVSSFQFSSLIYMQVLEVPVDGEHSVAPPN